MEGVCRGVSLQLIRLCGEVSLQLSHWLCGGVSLNQLDLSMEVCGGFASLFVLC